jgi:hypothetical protein
MGFLVKKADLQNDKDKILEFWQRNGYKSLDDSFFWKYMGNPNGDASVWLLFLEETSKVVGTIALFPRRMNIDGKVFLAGIFGDFLVHKKNRSIRPALSLLSHVSNSLGEGRFDVIYGFPNKKSEVIARRAGYQCFGQIQRYIKLFKSHRYLTLKRCPQLVARIVSPVIDFCLKKISFETWHRPPQNITFEKLNEFDHRLVDLYNDRYFEFKVVMERSIEYMNWKYFEHPVINYYVYGAFNNRGKMLGCMIYSNEGYKVNIRELVIRQEASIRKGVASGFLRYLRSTSAESVYISFLENENLKEEILSYGFWKIKKEEKIFVSHELQNKISPIISESNNWVLMRSDDDI